MKNTRALQTAGVLLTGMLSLAAQDPGWQVNGALAMPFGTAKDKMGLNYGLQVGAAYEIKTSGGYSVRPGFTMGYFNSTGVTGIRCDADDQIADQVLNGRGYPLNSDFQVAGSSVTHKTLQLQFALDAIVPLASKTNLVFGVSVNKYFVKFAGGKASSTWDTTDVSGNVTHHFDPGVYSPVDLDQSHMDPGANGACIVRSTDPNGTSWLASTVPSYKLGLRIGVEYAFTDKLSGRILMQQTELGRMTSIQGAMQTVNPFWVDFGVVYKF